LLPPRSELASTGTTVDDGLAARSRVRGCPEPKLELLTCPDKVLAQSAIGPRTTKSEKRSRAGLKSVEKKRGVEADPVDQPLPKQSRVKRSLNKGQSE
jgi:hypothetical protein